MLADGKKRYGSTKILLEDEHDYFANISPYSKDYFLALVKGDVMPFGCEELPSDVLASLTDRLKDSVWKPCLVNRLIDGKPPYSISKNHKISIINHPNTKKYKDNDGRVYYENVDIGLDTSGGLQLGQQVSSTDKRGVNKLYPPSPYAATGVGIPLPLDYSGSYDKKTGTFHIPHVVPEQETYGEEYKDRKYRVPIQECSAPIDIGLSSGPINAADFMKRAPKYAISIFREIDRNL